MKTTRKRESGTSQSRNVLLSVIPFVVLLWLILSMPARSEERSPGPKNLFTLSCKGEVEKFCSGATDFREIGKCLMDRHDELSNECKEGLQQMAQAAKQAAARGGGALGSFGGMSFLSPPVPLLSYEGRTLPSNDSASILENRGNFTMPIFKAENDTVSLSIGGGHLHLGKPVTLDSGTMIQQDLYRVEIGAQYFHQLTNKKAWGLRGSVGYSGDKVLNGTRNMSLSLNAFYRFPGSEKSSWILTIFFANNSPLGNFIPIPGFVYFYKTDTFRGIFGLPLAAIQWTPFFPWSFSLSLFGPTINSEVAYGEVDHFQIFTGFAWTMQQFMLSNRLQERDRLTFEEKKILVGLRTPIFRPLTCEIQIGKSFDRGLYIGDGFFNKDRGVASLEHGFYVSWSVRVAL